jgi:NAD+ kinase
MNILIITKKSTLTLMTEKGGCCEKKYFAKFPNECAELQRADKANMATRNLVLDTIKQTKHSCLVMTRAEFTPDVLKGINILITVGGDGTLLEMAKYVTKIPILGVNSDPTKSIGHFCTTNSTNFHDFFMQYIANAKTIKDVFEKLNVPHTRIPRFSLRINNKLDKNLILNDVYVTNQHHAEMIRVDVAVGTLNAKKNKKNSKNSRLKHIGFIRCNGLLISSAAGSSAWMYNEGGDVLRLDDMRLQYKELGKRAPHHGFTDYLKITSHMFSGLLCVDGTHRAIPFSFGDVIELQTDAKPICILGDLASKHNAFVK